MRENLSPLPDDRREGPFASATREIPAARCNGDAIVSINEVSLSYKGRAEFAMALARFRCEICGNLCPLKNYARKQTRLVNQSTSDVNKY
jgi:hypothetical protein